MLCQREYHYVSLLQITWVQVWNIYERNTMDYQTIVICVHAKSYGASLLHTLSAGYVAILNCNKNTYKF